MQEYHFRAMGCQMLAVVDSNKPSVAARLAAVPGWFEEWEQQLSRFRTDSDLSRLNTSNGHPMTVPPALWKVLTVALEKAEQSEGLVQPTMLAQLEAAGYDRSFDVLGLDNWAMSQHKPVLDWRLIALNVRTHTVTLPHGMRLDLGGVAKGWSADRAAHWLAALGPALVDAGGDITVSGPMADGQPWPIAIANPFLSEESLGTLLLSHGAVATSGRDYRRWMRGSVEQHHIIDPRTGRPARSDVLSATVIAPDGPTAEMAAKAALILGSQDGLKWLNDHPSFAGLLVLDNSRVVYSNRMALYLDQMNAQAHVALS